MAACCPGCRQHCDSAVAGRQLCALDTSRDHPQDRDLHPTLNVWEDSTDSRVASHNNHPGCMSFEELDEGRGSVDHLLPRLRSRRKKRESAMYMIDSRGNRFFSSRTTASPPT